MLRYVLARLLLTIPLLLGVSLCVFLLGELAPGDPVTIMLGEQATEHEIATLRRQLGLDLPLPVQFVRFVANAVRGDLGISFRSKRPVAEEIFSRFPATAELTAAGIVVGLTLGLGLGVTAALRHNSPWDRFAILVAMFGGSMPVFWSGLLLIVLFAVLLGWLPATGRGTPQHLVMPSLALGLNAAALIARITRSSMLETLGQDYVRTARAKGLDERAVVLGHALRNAAIPVATVVGLQVGGLLAGAVLTETVFAWPGIGRLVVLSIEQRDFPVLRGCVLLIATIFTLVNLALDVLFVRLDPRIRYH